MAEGVKLLGTQLRWWLEHRNERRFSFQGKGGRVELQISSRRTVSPGLQDGFTLVDPEARGLP